jgi:cytochrome c oxidase subunit II
MMTLVPLLSSLLQNQGSEGSFFFPPQASTFAAESDWLFHFILWVSLVAFIAVVGVTAWFAYRYHQSREPYPQPSPTHSTKLELIWSIIPSLFLVAFFWKGFTQFLDHKTAPAGAYQVNVVAQKWSWSFEYPTGATTTDLHVVKGRPFKMILSSKDVLHSFWVPAFRSKMDVVPGRYTSMWFEPTLVGEFPIKCTEYCGTNHWNMRSKVVVHETDAEFQEWLKAAANPYEGLSEVEAGRVVYQRRGCQGCHNLSGPKLTGPNFDQIFGYEREFEDGSKLVADEAYILESVNDPNAKVLKGYPPIMSNQGLSPVEQKFIVAFLKSIGK